MKTLFTAEAVSQGGRSGMVWSSDRVFNEALGNPLEAGCEHRGPSPELLFAGAYAACYHSALVKVAAVDHPPILDSRVRAMVSLVADDAGGNHLAVELHARLPGIEPAEAVRLMVAAHQVCPYSKALQHGLAVKLVVDGPAQPAEKAEAL
jgi:Ohr subfamily peroxiredoxin